MDRIQVALPAAEAALYPIFIGSGIFAAALAELPLQRYTKFAVLTDEQVAGHWLDEFCARLPLPPTVIKVPGGEGAKDLSSLRQIWEQLQAAGCDRQSLLFNLGGGMIGDLGGFAAAAYMRGMPFVQVPTSLLAQVDASVGGKVGVNFGGLKNFLGAFAQPAAVVIDTDTLKTLSGRELRAGFAEVLKHGLISDAEFFADLEVKCCDSFGAADYAFIIRRSCEIKAAVVSKDEREAGLRKVLNLGHTLGHAFEVLSQEAGAAAALLHGEAISLGILAEARLAEAAALLRSSEVERIETALRAYGLPVALSFKPDLVAVLERAAHDKKNRGERVNWTLLKSIGEALYDVPLEDDLVRSVLSKFLSQPGGQ